MSKRKANQEEDTDCVVGFVQTTSPIKQAMSSNVRYFDGTVQTTESEFMRFISFSPEKLGAFETAKNLKTPVKLSNIKLTPRGGKSEVCFNKHSTIKQITKALSFNMRSAEPQKIAPTKQIAEIDSANMMSGKTAFEMAVSMEKRRMVKTLTEHMEKNQIKMNY